MKKTIFTILVALATFSIVCYAGQIYEDARQAGIDYFNRGQYQIAAKQFVATQNIAPVNNDLSLWITKCNNKMVQSRNAKIQCRRVSNTQSAMQSAGQKIQRYDSIGHFGSANLALVRYQNRYGFINRDSILVVPIQYDDVYSIITEAIPGSSYDEFIKAYDLKWNWSWDKGQLMSVSKNGKWGYLNESGKEVVPVIYDDVRESIVFKDRNLIGVGNDEKYGFVDWNGSVVIPLEYEYVSRFYNGAFGTNVNSDMVPVVRNGKMGFIDEKGNTVIPFEYEPQYNLEYSVPVMFRPVWSDGKTCLKKNGKYGLVDLKGNAITEFKYDGKAEISIINVGGDYLSYYIFPLGDEKIYFFQGKEFIGELEFQAEILSRRIAYGNDDSIFELAALYWNNDDYQTAKKYAEMGANKGIASCERMLGIYYLTIMGDRDDLIPANKYIISSAKKGDAIAQYYLGLMYELGYVLDYSKTNPLQESKPNQVMANKWYRESAAQGFQLAIDKLAK